MYFRPKTACRRVILGDPGCVAAAPSEWGTSSQPWSARHQVNAPHSYLKSLMTTTCDVDVDPTTPQDRATPSSHLVAARDLTYLPPATLLVAVCDLALPPVTLSDYRRWLAAK